jgi:hypothetical protein
VTDPSGSAIDRVFDLVDSVVDKADRVLNRAKYTEDQHRSRRGEKRAKVIDVDTSPSVKTKTTESKVPATTSMAVTSKRFRVVEAIAPGGATIFVVTNGAVRAECTTRELAEKILRGLEAAP